MKKFLLISLSIAFFVQTSTAEFGAWASAIYLNTNGTSKFYSTLLQGDPNSIGTTNYGGLLGSFEAGSGDFSIRGAEIKTYKNNGGNVCGATLYYTVYPQGARPASPVFSPITLNFYCDWGSDGTFNSCGGGTCTNGSDQKWQKVDQSIDLTQYAVGTYVLELYYQLSGSATSGGCNEDRYDSNSGNNYTATFTITPPLAIHFSGLSGYADGSAIKLQWSIEDDADISNYVIERSLDGIHFTEVASVPSRKTEAPFLYTISDLSPSYGANYYRIKMVSVDNKVTYSRLCKISFNLLNGDIKVIMAQSNFLQIKLPAPITGKGRLLLIDNIGRRVLDKQLILSAENILSVNLPGIAKGAYQLIFSVKEEQHHVSFIVP